MISTVFFDVGNVLLFFSHERMCARLGAVCGCSAAEIDRRLFQSGFAELYDRGEVTTEDLWRVLGEAAGRAVRLEEAREAATEIFELNESIVPVVDALARSGFRLGVLSNTCAVHSEYFLRRFELFRRFHHLVLSHEIGVTKPNQGIFEAALSVSGSPAHDCFFVDDLAENVLAARRHGLEAEIYRSTEELTLQLEERGLLLARSPETGV